MALSNWDCAAFDTEGKPTTANFACGNRSLEIYKNWVYLHTPKEDVLRVGHGEVSLGQLAIWVARGKSQEAVFLFATLYDYKDDKSNHAYYSGIGCYGFRDTLDWLKENHPEEYAKIDPKYLDPTKDYMVGQFSRYGGKEDGEWGFDFLAEGDHVEYLMNVERPGLDELWIGTTKQTLEEFYEWLKTVAPEEYWQKLNINEALRFNQGDAFFAAAAESGIEDLEGERPVLENLDAAQPTLPEESKPPIISQMLGE